MCATIEVVECKRMGLQPSSFQYEKWSSGGSEQYTGSAPPGSQGSNSITALGLPDGFGSPTDSQVGLLRDMSNSLNCFEGGERG